VSDDDSAGRQRRKAARGRRLRVPVDEVPRQQTAPTEATLDDVDLEEIGSTPPVPPAPPAPPARPAPVASVPAPPRPAAAAPVSEPPPSIEVAGASEPPAPSVEVVTLSEPPPAVEVVTVSEPPPAVEVVTVSEPPPAVEVVTLSEPPPAVEVVTVSEPPPPVSAARASERPPRPVAVSRASERPPPVAVSRASERPPPVAVARASERPPPAILPAVPQVVEVSRASTVAEAPRSSVVVQRSMVIVGSPSVPPPPPAAPRPAILEREGEDELPPLDAEVTVPGMRVEALEADTTTPGLGLAAAEVESSSAPAVAVVFSSFHDETSTELTVEEASDPSDFAGLDDLDGAGDDGDEDALLAEPTRVVPPSEPPAPARPAPPAVALASVIIDDSASLPDEPAPEPEPTSAAAADAPDRESNPPEELATEELAPEEPATVDVAAPPRPAPPPAPPAAAAAPRPPPAPPAAPRVAPPVAPAAVAVSAPPPPAAPPPPVAPPPPAAPAEAAAPADASEPPKRKKRAKVWWEEFFNDDYLRTVRPPKPEQVVRQCNFLEFSLGLKKGATILDVGCGLGLQAVELASRGYLVVGLDLSLPMLSRAADEAQDREIKMNFLHGDMREMSFDGAFDAVLCLGTTFGYFDDDANRQVLERMKRALKPQGLLLLDVVNRDFVVQGQPNALWFEGDGCLCMEETQFNYITSRLHVKRTVIVEDGRQRENEYAVRLYPLHEVGQLMHQMGFRVAEVSGMEATPGVYFGATSPRLIILAERRVERPSGAMQAVGAGATPPPAPPSEPARPSTPADGSGGGESSGTPTT
jgi:SAM-dependent methyltransferase